MQAGLETASQSHATSQIDSTLLLSTRNARVTTHKPWVSEVS
jgi:hypothetical protein